jgi:hypothetical protein
MSRSYTSSPPSAFVVCRGTALASGVPSFAYFLLIYVTAETRTQADVMTLIQFGTLHCGRSGEMGLFSSLYNTSVRYFVSFNISVSPGLFDTS